MVNQEPNLQTYEAQYVQKTIGSVLTKALAELVVKRPTDPIEYLAKYLYKTADNIRINKEEQEIQTQVNILREEEERERQKREEMRKEEEAIKQLEENERKEKEAQERRKRELEELARRKEEIANIPPSLPVVKEIQEEALIVDFGTTQLHQLAAQEGANLLAPLKKRDLNLAARNEQYLTAYDIAEQQNLSENIKQFDEFIIDLVTQEDYKTLEELVVNGFDKIGKIVETNLGNKQTMEEKGHVKQAEHVYVKLPELALKVSEIKDAINKNNLNSLKNLLDKKSLAFFRDENGKSSLHLAIEKQYFEIAIFLFEKYQTLAKLNDCVNSF